MEQKDGVRRIRQPKPVQQRDERRERIRSRYQNKRFDVTIIEADEEVAKPNMPPPKRKVCAYCRVSTDEDEQLSSYELQVQYYPILSDRVVTGL